MERCNPCVRIIVNDGAGPKVSSGSFLYVGLGKFSASELVSKLRTVF